MEEVEYVPKRGYNDFFRYKYVTEGDLVSAIRPLLAAAGVIIIPSLVEEERLEGVISERSGPSTLTRVVMEYIVTDGKESFTFRIPGHGADRSDKGVYKAMTGSMKYALMKLFQVETGDDPERDTGDGPVETAVQITGSSEEVEKGGRSKKATRYQLQRVAATMREKAMERPQLISLINQTLGVDLVLPDEEEAQRATILSFLQDLDGEDIGALIQAIDAWREGHASS